MVPLRFGYELVFDIELNMELSNTADLEFGKMRSFIQDVKALQKKYPDMILDVRLKQGASKFKGIREGGVV